ncbi:MAG: tRNA (adenosine(37)-N6)-threonylcarbamoyltransferase complex transferase subunit TsaD [Candidatus Saccharimonadales bacterium]
MKILGIETSCDETSVGIVEDGFKLLSNSVASSMDLHQVYGGVVPEIAARSHIEVISSVIRSAFEDADCDWSDIDAIAVTYGAGLSGSLLIGVMVARTLAIVKNKPLYAANHVLGHVYANFLTSSSIPGYAMPTHQPKFPMLSVIVSGGHSQLMLFNNHFDYQLLGRTQDDAIGEAFDKVAKILGLGYPGGPAISAAAKNGSPGSISLPIAKVSGYDFSFSGLKTAVLRRCQELIGEDFTFPSYLLSKRLNDAQKADIAASFERVACQTIVSKAKSAFTEFQPSSLVIAGGVAANSELRSQLTSEIGIPLAFPDIKLCTDNGAMIAALGSYMHQNHQILADPYSLDVVPNLTV